MFSLDNNGIREDKIIAVHVDDPVYREYTDINQLPSHRVAEIRSFFEDYQLNEDKVRRGLELGWRGCWQGDGCGA